MTNQTRRQDERKPDERENGEDRRESEQASPERNRSNRNARRAMAVGLAATSVGALAGATTAGTSADPAEVAKKTASGGAEATDAVVDFVVQEEWDITPAKNENVDFFIEFLMGKNYDKTNLWLERLGKYGPMIQQKLAERDMPQDLIWLATIESGLDPNAYSSADAAGLWQFIEETGERYGLEVSTYVDERRDPVAATDAALDYLNELNERFNGSWYLAAAGYNTGENRVERIANERAGGEMSDDVFWRIAKHLPSETRDYVPVMLAMGHIGKNPDQYGFTNVQRQAPLQYDEVLVPGGIGLADVAAAAGVDADEVIELNPHLVKEMTPPDREWMVRIPAGTQDTFASNWTVGPAAENV